MSYKTHSDGARWNRAMQMARRRKTWSDMLGWLDARHELLEQAVLEGQQPLQAIVVALHAEFGTALDDRATKVFIGVAMSGVLDEWGFDVLSRGERMSPNVAGFQTSARYVQRTHDSSAELVANEAEDDVPEDDILQTMLNALSASQRRRLVLMIGSM